ncbi:hypothetical protein EJ02DRAFT_303868, partial [Clathrospora elynae]
GHIEDIKDIDTGMCDLFGAGHGTSTYEFTSSNGHQQLCRKLRDEGEKDHAILDLDLNKSFNRSSQGKYLNFHPIRESGATEEHHSATNF